MGPNEILASVQLGFPILSMLIWLPVAGIAAIAALPGARTATHVAVLVSAAELLLALVLMSSFNLGVADLQFVERPFGFYVLGIDGISALFLPLTALLTLLATFSAYASVTQNLRSYQIALLGLCACLMGAFAAADLRLFWLFLSLEALPAWLLIARHGTGAQCTRAATHYLAVMAIASGLLFVGLEFLIAETGGADFRTALGTPVPAAAQPIAFVLIGIALAIKAPIFPFHSWLPRVLEQGPVVGVGVFLVGVKIGTYGFLRVLISMLPETTSDHAPMIAALGAVGMVYAALIALAQSNLRRLLAYASVSHMGFVVLGLFSMNLYGLQGGLLQMMTIGMAVAGLYFIAGFLSRRVGAPEVASLGDLVRRTPLLALVFLALAMAAVGMPGTSGFNGEHLVVIGAYKLHWGFAVCAGAGVVLTAAYFLTYFQRAFLAERRDGAAPIQDLSLSERAVALTMLGAVFLVGLYTSPFLRIAEGSLAALAARVETRVAAHDAPRAQGLLAHDEAGGDGAAP